MILELSMDCNVRDSVITAWFCSMSVNSMVDMLIEKVELPVDTL